MVHGFLRIDRMSLSTGKHRWGGWGFRRGEGVRLLCRESPHGSCTDCVRRSEPFGCRGARGADGSALQRILHVFRGTQATAGSSAGLSIQNEVDTDFYTWTPPLSMLNA